jgi:hypothetical protein
MAKRKYLIRLSDKEKETLTRIVCEGTESERTIMRARILLMSDSQNSKKTSVSKLAEMLSTTNTTIQTVRTEYATEGFEYALYRKKREVKHYNSKVSEKVIQYIVALSESEPPNGAKRWSCKQLAEAAIAEGIVDSISSVTVLRILQQSGSDSIKIRKRKPIEE